MNILIENLVKTFGTKTALNIQELKINNGELIVIVGNNGAGKTTSIGKMARLYQEQGKKVLLAAADTFRAAAIDQLKVWADRTGSRSPPAW